VNDFLNTTEEDSIYQNLDEMSISELLVSINQQDALVSKAVKKQIPQIEKLIKKVTAKLKTGGRLFYIGAGTSGRLGILDASECPPTFGVSHNKVIGLIAGGDSAIRKAVENAEDNFLAAWEDLKKHNINAKDFVVGIAASGSTPYVIGGLENCQKNNVSTGCITCNKSSPIVSFSDYPIEVVVGPEFVTGSTRMKAGTAQKMVLNMITTSTMVKLGKVEGNKMVNMQLSNRKLIQRGTKMIVDNTGISEQQAKRLLLENGSVRNAIKVHQKNN